MKFYVVSETKGVGDTNKINYVTHSHEKDKENDERK